MDWFLLFCVLSVVPSLTLGRNSDHNHHRSRKSVAKKIVELARRNHHQGSDLRSIARQMSSIPNVEDMVPQKVRNNMLVKHTRNMKLKPEGMGHVLDRFDHQDNLPNSGYRNPFGFMNSNNHVLNAVRKVFGELNRSDRDRYRSSGRRQRNLAHHRKLPRTEESRPGHSLLQPSRDMLESSAKYPGEEKTSLVYGNQDQIGVNYGSLPQRLYYSDFRKHKNVDAEAEDGDADEEAVLAFLKHNGGGRRSGALDIEQPEIGSQSILLNALLNAIQRDKPQEHETHAPHKHTHSHNVQVAVGPSDLKAKYLTYRPLHEYLNLDDAVLLTDDDRDRHRDGNDNDNKASEIVDSSEEERRDGVLRRQNDKLDVLANCTGSMSNSEDSSSGERNPGNPYTVFKGKYKQNWLWNHFMDGDHMNINPYGPQFNSLGPSGTELFFNRKWWYFNQDDYKPFR